MCSLIRSSKYLLVQHTFKLPFISRIIINLSPYRVVIFLRAIIAYDPCFRSRKGTTSLLEYCSVYISSAFSCFRFSSSSSSIGRLSSMIFFAASFKLVSSFCNVWTRCCGTPIFSSCASFNSALTLLCAFAFTWARYGEQLTCGWSPAFLTRSALELSVPLKDVNTPL